MNDFYVVLPIVLALALAFINGGNDNLKGVATLIGSKVLNYRKGLWLASIATGLGSMLSIVIAGALIAKFGGKGLLPDELVQSVGFISVVAGAAFAVVAIATRVGIPVSTTHALVGALLGAGLLIAPAQVHYATLMKSFLIPLLVSPMLSITISFVLTRLAQYALVQTAAAPALISSSPEQCVCTVPATNILSGSAMMSASTAGLVIDHASNCERAGAKVLFNFKSHSAGDYVHMLSGAAVCFARGLNDTPKIAALLVAAEVSGLNAAISVTIAMLVGGVLTARKVTATMSEKITNIPASDGRNTNLVTSSIVIGASVIGLPVSTTHVSCGAIFGLAMGRSSADWKVIRAIVSAWLVTLPSAALCAYILSSFFL